VALVTICKKLIRGKEKSIRKIEYKRGGREN
jgi:hypothetical protein